MREIDDLKHDRHKETIMSLDIIMMDLDSGAKLTYFMNIYDIGPQSCLFIW